MSKNEICNEIGRHLYCANPLFESFGGVIIIADSNEEAEEKAKMVFGSSSVNVSLAVPTEDPQVYRFI